jgi:hypothetical protein
MFSSFVNGKKTRCGAARMNNAFSADGGISFKTIGVLSKEKKRCVGLPLTIRLKRIDLGRKLYWRRKEPYANSRSKRIR